MGKIFVLHCLDVGWIVFRQHCIEGALVENHIELVGKLFVQGLKQVDNFILEICQSHFLCSLVHLGDYLFAVVAIEDEGMGEVGVQMLGEHTFATADMENPAGFAD